MAALVEEVSQASDPLVLAERALGVRPLRAVRQNLSESGNAVYRVDLPNQQSAVLRTSPRPKTFAFTRGNLDVLRALGLPVQSVLQAGPTEAGGSYIMLNWLPGRDLVNELATMSRAQMSRLAEQTVECQRRAGKLPQAARFGWAPIGRNGNLAKWTQVFGEPAAASTPDDGTAIGKLRSRLCILRSRVEPYFDTVRPIPFLDDLTLKNVLIDHGQLSGIIDLDFICYGDPLMSVGATMAAIAGDVPAASFYGEELTRLWNPKTDQRLAIWFYAALWAIGSLHLTDAKAYPARAKSLAQGAEAWLDSADAHC